MREACSWADLKKANIDYISARGQRADFHSLRTHWRQI
jgi:hypothetical protein